MDDTPLIFISYASPDRDRVTEFYDHLSSGGFNVWMDKRRLKGGQNWDFEIKRALEKAVVVVVFLSQNSVDRRGYAQREIKMALDHAQEKLVDDIYIVPVMLDPVPIPDQLKRLQVIQADESSAKADLGDALAHQLERLGVEIERVQGETKLRWTMQTYRDHWEGLPGYDTEFQLLRFSSEENPAVAEITEIVKGWLLGHAMFERRVKFSQSPELFNFGDSRFARQNSWDASCGEPRLKERMISISYSVWWYAARAAHPNQFFKTFNFTLDPLTQISELEEIFEDADAALMVVRDEARRQLMALEFDGMTNNGSSIRLLDDYVRSGTETWGDFSNFVFGEDSIELLFSSYQVAAYAFGPQFASIPYAMVVKLMRKEYAFALGIEHMQRDIKPWPISLAEESPKRDEAAEESH